MALRDCEGVLDADCAVCPCSATCEATCESECTILTPELDDIYAGIEDDIYGLEDPSSDEEVFY